jgi:isopropylmalate/homocitrate/citramalate synthase
MKLSSQERKVLIWKYQNEKLINQNDRLNNIDSKLKELTDKKKESKETDIDKLFRLKFKDLR